MKADGVMSDISPTPTSTTLRLKPAVTDVNSAQSRGQAGPTTATSSTAPAGDTVTISASARAATPEPGAGAVLTEDEAQNTAVSLRQQIGLAGLSASARQNAAVLSLIRPQR
jgi:hypothetical protein